MIGLYNSLPKSKYDYTKLVADKKHESQYKDFPEYIREKSRINGGL